MMDDVVEESFHYLEDFFDEPIDLGDDSERPPDPVEESAIEYLRAFIEENREQVFFSRRLEVQNEDKYFHWITNRAIRYLEVEGLIRVEWRKLSTAGKIKLLWHKNFRYYKRYANSVTALVEEYSHHTIGEVLGLHGETMILTGFAEA